ncbi:MAG: DNA methyltransferase [Aestuariivita sp.]|nr:DNA methyltransferase [Aestuariivita sp.]
MNRLYYGDCLTVMQSMNLASVDLIYLDPPFNSQRDYNAIYKDETGRPLPDQIDAFCDQWTLDEETERAIRQQPVLMRENGIDDAVAEFWRLWMQALRNTNPRLLAYLTYMVQRLLPMRGLLKPTGSLYLHCDPTAGHYIKVLLDAIFGHKNFRNEITWKRTNAHPLSIRKFDAITDSIFFYTNSSKYTFNGDFMPMTEAQVDELYKVRDQRGRYSSTDLTGGKKGGPEAYKPLKGVLPSTGRAWAPPTLDKLPNWAQQELGDEYTKLNQLEKCYALDDIGLIHWTKRGRPRFKRYLEGPAEQLVPSLWTDITPALGDERLGYDTQKPLALLERIIRASSNPGDVVMDPFCGCATTLEAAQKLGREWIGIDIAIHAIKRVAKVRLEDRLSLVEGQDFTIDGVPKTWEGASDLWQRDKYHFQKWAVEQVDGFVTTKRTADGGIDGRIYFDHPDHKDFQSMALEVKGGKNVGIAVLRELRGVIQTDQAQMAGLIVLNDPSDRQMASYRRFMAESGDLDVYGVLYPRFQILTVEQILKGERFKMPSPRGRGAGQVQMPIQQLGD